jgi:hypothetical protein
MDQISRKQWQTAIEGMHYRNIYTYPICKVPIVDLFSPKAVEIFDNLKESKRVSLDVVCESVATMVKETMKYDFENVTAARYYELSGKKTLPPPENPTLSGICGDGSRLGMILFEMLGVQGASDLGTDLQDGYGHSVVKLRTEAGYRIVNMLSGSMPFGLIKTQKQLERIGRLCEYGVDHNMVQHEGSFGNPNEQIDLYIDESIWRPVFEVDSRIMSYKGSIAANLGPNTDDYTCGNVVPIVGDFDIGNYVPEIVGIKERKLWFPGITHKNSWRRGDKRLLCRDV